MCVVFLVATGCASSGPSDAAFKKLTEELNTLRVTQVAMSERLSLLEATSPETRDATPREEASEVSTSPAPALKVVKLTPGSSEGDIEANEDPASPAERTVIRMNAKGVVVAESTKIDPNLGKSDIERARRLYEDKEYDKALGAFSAFVSKYPESPRVAEATYFRGACYAKKADWTRAKDQFLTALSTSPKGDAAPSALFDLIGAYEKLGEPEAAEKMKQRLLAEFPSSKAAKRL